MGGNVRKKVAPEPSVYDGHVTAQSHPDTDGTVRHTFGRAVDGHGIVVGYRPDTSGTQQSYGSEYCSTAVVHYGLRKL